MEPGLTELTWNSMNILKYIDKSTHILENRMRSNFQVITHSSPPTNQSSKSNNHSTEIKSFLEEEFMTHSEPLKHKRSLTPEDENNIIKNNNAQCVLMSKVNNNSMVTGIHRNAYDKISMLTDSQSPKSYNYINKRSKRSISKSIIEADAQGRLELVHVITNPKLLNVFAQFLCVQFSIENLLFIIEIVQFKRYIRATQNDCSSILGEYFSIPEHEDL